MTENSDTDPTEPTSQISEGQPAEQIPDGSGSTSDASDGDAEDDTASGGPAK